MTTISTTGLSPDHGHAPAYRLAPDTPAGISAELARLCAKITAPAAEPARVHDALAPIAITATAFDGHGSELLLTTGGESTTPVASATRCLDMKAAPEVTGSSPPLRGYHTHDSISVADNLSPASATARCHCGSEGGRP